MPSSVRSLPSPHAIGAAQMVAWGVTFYAIPPLLPRMTRELALELAWPSLAMTAGLVVSAFASVAVGAWIQHRGARAPMAGGTAMAALALIGMACSTSAMGVLLALFVLSTTSAALLYEPAFAAVGTQVSDPQVRFRFIRIITFWGGLAALWAIPTVDALAEAWSWRAALVVLAILLFVQTWPVHRRMPPATTVRGITRGELSGGPTRFGARMTESRRRLGSLSIQIRRTLEREGVVGRARVPRRAAVGFALGTCATGAVVVHGIFMLIDRSVDVQAASFAFAMVAPAQLVGRFWLLGRAELGPLEHALPFVSIASGLAALIAAPSALALILFVAMFGAGAGLLTPVRAAMVATLVPADSIAVEQGKMTFLIQLGRAAAPVVGAFSYALLGFQGALVAMAVLSILGGALVASVRSCGPCGSACTAP